MDEQQKLHTSFFPKIPQPVVLGFMVLLCGAWASFWIQKTLTIKKPQQTTVVTPTPISEPSQKRQPSYLATQSAYLVVSQTAASLSASLNALNITDTTMNPPVVEIPIGFPTPMSSR